MVTRKRSDWERKNLSLPSSVAAAEGDPYTYEPVVPGQEDERFVEIAARADRAEALYEALELLPDRQAEYIRCSLQGMTQAEMAEMLGVSEAAVSQGLTRAKAALAAELADLY